MNGSKDLRDDEILRFLRFAVVESAAATYTQQAMDTQLSIDRGLIWLIHFIEHDLGPQSIDDPAQGTLEYIRFQITRESKAAMVDLDNPDAIYMSSSQMERGATIGTDAGPMWTLSDWPKQAIFSPPIPYAAQTIYIAAQSTSGSARTVRGRIGYTMKRVTDKFFFRVAQALIS
jgi:hypothetical protein